MSKQLKHWLKLVTENQNIYNQIYPVIRKQVLKTNPETSIVLTGGKQLGKNLFSFEIIITIDMQEELVDAENNGWSVKHEVISIDFLKFDIINEHEVSILTDLQTRLIRNAVDSYLRYNYTI